MTLNPVAQTITADEARRLTERIRLTAHTARESIEKLHTLLAEAKAGEAHTALGYASWTAYLSDVLGEEPLRLARDQRQELVGFLAGEGMSTRAIAPIVGVHRDTVAEDLRSGGGNPPPAKPEPRDEFDGADWVEPGPDADYRCPNCNGVSSVDHDDPEDCHCGCDLDADCRAIEAEIVEDEPARVTGLDGKSYPKPTATPAGPRRKPLPDQARAAGWELRKAVERLERIAANDRFTANKEAMAPHLRSHLTNAIEVCQDLLDRINQ